MQQQVFHDLLQDLGKSQDALAELPFLLVLQQDLTRLGRFAQCRFFDVGQPGYGPENMTRQDYYSAVLLRSCSSVP